MATMAAAFGASHSTMLFSAVESWQAMFDHVDVRAPINDLDGTPRSFDELLKVTPPEAARLITPETQAERHRITFDAMDRLEQAIEAANLDTLIIIGDDQREIFQDACRPAIAVYYGDTIRNAPAPATPATDWYVRDQRSRLEDKTERFYPCNAALGSHLIAGLMERDFDITAVKALVGEQFEGHAYSFIHRRLMRNRVVPIVPVFLNTYYAPNQPSPARCIELGRIIRVLVDSFPANTRVGILASGGLSHFLVNEDLDNRVIAAIKAKDFAALAALPKRLLNTGSSEIRNWMTVAAAVPDMSVDWLTYVPGYRSRALTGVGLCFAQWK